MPTAQLATALPTATTGTWAARETRYAANAYNGTGSRDSVRALPGSSGVLLCAPHAVMHRREGADKLADLATGGLVETVAAACDAWAVIADGYQVHDGNFAADGPFKDAVAAARTRVRVVLDVHGMRDGLGVDVCLGRGAAPDWAAPLVPLAVAVFTAHGLTVGVDAPFDAARPTTVTSTSQRAATPAMQIELSRSCRTLGDPKARRALAALLELTARLAATDLAVPSLGCSAA